MGSAASSPSYMSNGCWSRDSNVEAGLLADHSSPRDVKGAQHPVFPGSKPNTDCPNRVHELAHDDDVSSTGQLGTEDSLSSWQVGDFSDTESRGGRSLSEQTPLNTPS